MIKIIYGLIVSALMALLISCGSDNISSERVPNGVFNGALAGEDAIVLVWDNTAHVLATDDSQMEINFTVSRLSSTGNDPDVTIRHVTGHGRKYDRSSDTFSEVTISGSFTHTDINTTFELTITDANNSEDKLFLLTSSTSNDSASFTLLDGTYLIRDIGGLMIIDDMGIISGSDNNDCEYEGDVEIPDPNINIYQVFMTVHNCSLNGHYTGLGTLDQSIDTFMFSMSNTERLLQYRLQQ